ncbi:MAG: KdsC family phosphatase [Puniceicoccaceae bacterium]
MGNTPQEESIRWERIKVLLLDSDGVLTDGGVFLPESGAPEYRRFDIKDGFGITRLLSGGFPLAVISRSPSVPVRIRCERLGIPHVFLGAADKTACAAELLERLGLAWRDAAFMGDDVPDLPLLGKVGFPLAPADASPEVLRAAAWVSGRPGGSGAVREACDRIHFARSAG